MGSRFFVAPGLASMGDGLTKKYKVDKLVYFESTNDMRVAIEREKQIERWRREKKIALIESVNAAWRDLYDELCH